MLAAPLPSLTQTAPPLHQRCHSVPFTVSPPLWSGPAASPLVPSPTSQLLVGLLPLVTTSSVGMILSPALEPIPHRLVHRIQTGHFLEMRELISDNIALHNQLESIQGRVNLAALPSTVLRTRQREVTSLVSWIYCFIAYAAVRTSDTLARNMLVYCRLIISEALLHGGQRWQEYDRTFRQ